MANRPDVAPRDWICVGGSNGPSAVICQVYESGSPHGDLEVVYLDRDRAINESVQWNGSGWEFLYQGPSGGYADHSSRLAEFVSQLRSGRRA